MGFDQSIPLKDFNLVQKFLIMMKHVLPYKQVWDIKDFSKLDSECCDSKPFNARNYKWYRYL